MQDWNGKTDHMDDERIELRAWRDSPLKDNVVPFITPQQYRDLQEMIEELRRQERRKDDNEY